MLTGRVIWYYAAGAFMLRFVDAVTGASYVRSYKTQAAAKAAETRYYNRLTSLYGVHYAENI